MSVDKTYRYYRASAIGASIGVAVSVGTIPSRVFSTIEYDVDDRFVGAETTARLPHIRGIYRSDTFTIQVENIEKGVIDAGQNFIFNCIAALLEQLPETTCVHLANINHAKTRRFLQSEKSAGDLIDPSRDSYTGPLIQSLMKLGFDHISVRLDGAFWGLVGQRATC